MAVVNTKSTAVGNGDSTVRQLNSPYIENGETKSSIALVSHAASDSNTSVYRMIRVPSNARFQSLKFFCDAHGAGALFTLGVFDILANGGTAVSAALFATGLDASVAITLGNEILFQNNAIANTEKRLWELLGLAKDSVKFYVRPRPRQRRHLTHLRHSPRAQLTPAPGHSTK